MIYSHQEAILLIIVSFFILYSLRFVRSFQLRLCADKYNLNYKYDQGFKFGFKKPLYNKHNICSGHIGKTKVLLFDVSMTNDIFDDSNLYYKKTIIIINGKQFVINKSTNIIFGQYNRYSKVSDIKRILESIRINNIDYNLLTETDNNPIDYDRLIPTPISEIAFIIATVTIVLYFIFINH